jgi:hypothetical protein
MIEVDLTLNHNIYYPNVVTSLPDLARIGNRVTTYIPI